MDFWQGKIVALKRKTPLEVHVDFSVFFLPEISRKKQWFHELLPPKALVSLPSR